MIFPSNNSDNMAYGNVNVSASEFPEEIKKRVSDLRDDFYSGLHQIFIKYASVFSQKFSPQLEKHLILEYYLHISK